jgi:hypothetical protein
MSPKRPVPQPVQAAAATDLEKVNERLRNLITSLRGEKERLAESHAMTPAPGARPAVTPAPGVLPAATPVPHAGPDAAERRLAAELASAREAADEIRAERDRLKERLAEIEAEHRRMCDEYVSVQEQSTEVARLYVALDRLHRAVSRDDAVAAIQEIVINLVGSEEFGIYERRGERLEVLHAFGLDRARWASFDPARGAVGRAASGAEVYVAGRDGAPAPEDADLSAVIPLRVGDRVSGVIAIFRLLGHKPILDDHDQAVFDLLAAHAGLALHLRPADAGAARA